MKASKYPIQIWSIYILRYIHSLKSYSIFYIKYIIQLICIIDRCILTRNSPTRTNRTQYAQAYRPANLLNIHLSASAKCTHNLHIPFCEFFLWILLFILFLLRIPKKVKPKARPNHWKWITLHMWVKDITSSSSAFIYICVSICVRMSPCVCACAFLCIKLMAFCYCLKWFTTKFEFEDDNTAAAAASTSNRKRKWL